ncbi:arsenate reductase family protein [Maribacter sp. 2307ULW6-5]|uniref:arsenate reductase family protein n=1 Tax=Maribacter sp. 2307ULW6-5 TaxID=3386275 RepID=UPI0039BCF40F
MASYLAVNRNQMGVISTNGRQMTLYYYSGNSIGKQTRAYVAASDKKILAVDIAKDKVTGTQWAELAHGLEKPVSYLVNTDHPDFKEQYGTDTVTMSDDDWFKVLQKSPALLRHPLVLHGDKVIAIETGAQFKEYMAPDSAGLDKPYR